MNSGLIAILTLVVATNPAVIRTGNASNSNESRRPFVIICFLSSCGLFTLGSLAGSIFTLLDVSSATFSLAAALVIGLNSGRWLLVPKPRSIDGDLAGGHLYAALHLLGPAPVFAAIAGGGDAGILYLLLACAISFMLLILVVFAQPAIEKVRTAIIQFFGGSGIVITVIMGIDAARTV